MRLPTPATALRMPASVRLSGRSPRPGYPGFVVEEKSAARGSVRGPRRLRARVSALMLVLAVAGCAQSPSDPAADKNGGDAAHNASPSVVSAPTSLTGAGEFKRKTTAAIVYNRKFVPKGAQASLTAESVGGKTVTSLVVEGLLPNHRYGAHLHVAPCGDHPGDAGAHFQHVAGRADAASEVWLDLKTDDSGAGRATAHHDWPLTGAMPRSLVLHSTATAPSDPPAARVACLTLS